MSSSVADRALAAHTAQVEEARLRKEADEVRIKAEATDAILRGMDKFGLCLTDESFVRGYHLWQVEVQVDDDARLEFKKQDSKDVEVRIRPADQLYWDLPPGEETKGTGGGCYGCHGLGEIRNREITTLAELGSAIARIRDARESWRVKHLSASE